ncbi:MAG: hypothetical protein M0R80_02340 [Proteobacteria bacterium]|jgi:KaiC/GvpD/RAD55 family RecA-like ATPase|nr:hypothetical protein [Pseudomonadota bacterium]
MPEIDVSKYEEGAFDDPDVQAEVQYQWEENFQRTILSLLLNDAVFLTQSFGLIKPFYFTNEVHKEVANWLFKYFDQYKVLPKRLFIEQFIADRIKEKPADVKMHWRAEINNVYEHYVPGVEDRDYLRDRILDFAKEQAIKAAFFSCMDELKYNHQDKWSIIQTKLQDALSVDRDFDIGEEYFQTYEQRYDKMIKSIAEGDIFTSGFESIDNAMQGGGMQRGEIASWIGLSGSGKSLCLIKAAVANIHRGKKVLYISTELDESRVAERFDAQLADPGNRYGIGIKNLIPNKDIVFQSLQNYTKDYEDPRRLVIKHFPSGEMDVATMQAYYKQLQMRGFVPDLVIVDYIGEMKDFAGMKTYESRFLIIRALKGFASREKVCLLTAMQATGDSRSKVNMGELIDDDNLADAKGQTRPLDALWSLNQRKVEYEAKVARVSVVKTRFGECRFEFWIEMDRDRTLGMQEISKAEFDKRINEVSANKEVTARHLEELQKKATDKRSQLQQITDEKKRLKAEKKFKSDPGEPIE